VEELGGFDSLVDMAIGAFPASTVALNCIHSNESLAIISNNASLLTGNSSRFQRGCCPVNGSFLSYREFLFSFGVTDLKSESTYHQPLEEFIGSIEESLGRLDEIDTTVIVIRLNGALKKSWARSRECGRHTNRNRPQDDWR
jgi:hypothetical protein